MDIDIHISRVETGLSNKYGVVELAPFLTRKLPPQNSRVGIRISIRFFDQSILHFREVVETGKCYPQIIRYSYHYVNQNGSLFRYDNTEHYPQLDTFPHHKHVFVDGVEQVIAARCPRHQALFEEIWEILDSAK